MTGPATLRGTGAALRWTCGAAALTLVVQLGYTAYTARHVPAAALGAYALALTAVQLLGHVAGAGIATCLLRIERLTRPTVHAAMRLGAVTGLACFTVAEAAAQLPATMLRMPELTPLLRLLACQFLCQPAAVAAVAALRRCGRSRAAALTEVAGHAGGAAAGILLLARGFSPLGIAAMLPVAAALMLGIGAVLLHRTPLPDGVPVKAGSLLGLSGFLTGFGLLRFATNSVPLWAAGRLLGPGAAGLYSRAALMCDVPLNFLVKGMNQAMVPVFAEVRGQGRDIGRPAELTLYGASAAGFIGFGAAAGAGPAALALLLGPGWESAAALVPALCAAAALQLVYSAGCSVDLARGRRRELLATQLGLMLATAAGLALAFAWRHSPAGLPLFACAAAAGPAVGHGLQLLRWGRCGLVGVRAVLRAHLVHAGVGAAAGVLTALAAALAEGPGAALLYAVLALAPVALCCAALRAQLPVFAALAELRPPRRESTPPCTSDSPAPSTSLRSADISGASSPTSTAVPPPAGSPVPGSTRATGSRSMR